MENKYTDKVIDTIRKLKDKGVYLVVLALDERVEERLNNLNISCKSIKNYSQYTTEKYHEYKIASDLIKNWGKIIIKEDIILKDFLSHRDISLWDSHQVELQLYFISKMIKQIEGAKHIIKMERPEIMIIAADFNNIVQLRGIRFDKFLLKTLFEIGKTESIDTTYLGLSDSKITKFLILLKPYLALGKDILRKFQLSLRKARRNNKSQFSWAKTMFLNHTTRNADAILPIMKRMKDDNKSYEILVIQIGPDGEERFETESIPYRRLEKYLRPLVTIRIFISSFLILKKWFLFNKLISQQSDIKKNFVYQDIDLWSLGNEIFKSFWSVLSRSIRNLELANIVIEREKPDIIIGTNERSGNYRLFYELARTKKIPYLSVQYGLIDNHPIWSVPIAADIMAVEGRKVIDSISKAGANTDKLIITGQPKYDTLLDKYSKISKDEIFAKYGLDPKKKLILYTSHTFGEEQSEGIRFSAKDDLSKYYEEISAIYESVSRMEDTQLVVKPHPNNDRIDLHHKVLKKRASLNVHIVSNKSDVNELIIVCDVLITRHSTTGLDALILGKELVVVNLANKADSIPYVEYGAALGAYKKEDVFPVISKIFDEKIKYELIEGRERFISDFAYRRNGKAAQRIIDLIEELLCRN
ncbi:MAG: CDP-glycerol glycerophosphotransferase family protein [Thermodesulfobacteriota bacterium]|nr:CDP-glycerol glycerophosphotransferase family protein [Thermodesulfobacteriota bacterium]